MFTPSGAKESPTGPLFAVVTFLHIVVGELAPKSLAILKSESVAIAVAPAMRVMHGFLWAPAWLLTKVSNGLLRISGINPTPVHDTHSEEEIRLILQQARSAGLLGASRTELLNKAMSLPTKTARHLMVPRNEVIFFDAQQPLDENIARAMGSAHTRFPLCERELDDVIGVIDIRRVLYETDVKQEDLRHMAEQAVYFPEMMTGERLLSEFRDRRISMAIIVDEYGGASGIVTAADIVSAVMGELDEDDDDDVVALPGGAYDVDGTAPIEDVEERLKITIESSDMRTVAGLLMERLGRMPRVGDRIVESGYMFHVLDVSGPRVRRVRVQLQKGPMVSESRSKQITPPSGTKR